MTSPTAITFEEGYRRLQEIAEEVNETEVPVDRMGDLFAEGKGLDKALTDHLAKQKERIERIEKGEEIQAFHIASASSENAGGDATESDPRLDEVPSDSKEGDSDQIPF
jgi:exodeoxyribonuclease VII small subunit